MAVSGVPASLPEGMASAALAAGGSAKSSGLAAPRDPNPPSVDVIFAEGTVAAWKGEGAGDPPFPEDEGEEEEEEDDGNGRYRRTKRKEIAASRTPALYRVVYRREKEDDFFDDVVDEDGGADASDVAGAGGKGRGTDPSRTAAHGSDDVWYSEDLTEPELLSGMESSRKRLQSCLPQSELRLEAVKAVAHSAALERRRAEGLDRRVRDEVLWRAVVVGAAELENEVRMRREYERLVTRLERGRGNNNKGGGEIRHESAVVVSIG